MNKTILFDWISLCEHHFTKKNYAPRWNVVSKDEWLIKLKLFSNRVSTGFGIKRET
jgi:hypothetical protein